jgi:exportin-2 (importin alpha re-exporter)
VNALVNVTDFFHTVVLPHLSPSSATSTGASATEKAILQADGLKYLVTFRHHLSHAAIRTAFPLVVEMLKDRNVVVHTYAAVCLEKIITIKKDTTLCVFCFFLGGAFSFEKEGLM